MSDLPATKPRLLMFLHGMLMLVALGGFLGLISYAVLSLRDLRAGNFSINLLTFVFSLVTLCLATPAVYFLNKDKPIGRSFGIAAYGFSAVRSLVSIVWFALPSTQVGKYFSKEVFMGIAVFWFTAYLVAACALAFSPKIKDHFRPEIQPSEYPPPPPEFTD